MVKKSSCVKVSTDKKQVQNVVDAIKGDATIFIGETRVKSQVEFVMLFGANFDAVLKQNKFFMTDMRVLFAVLNKMAYGNQLSIKQKSIADELGIAPPHVSTSWKKLLKAGVFVKDQFGNEFVNFDLFLKGKGKTVAEKFEEQASLSHDVLQKQNIKTKRPFRSKAPEKAPVAKRITKAKSTTQAKEKTGDLAF